MKKIEALADAEAERVIIGALLLDQSCIDRIENLPADDFSNFRLRTLYTSAREVILAGKQLDYLTLEDHVREKGELGHVGDVAQIATLADDLPVGASVNVDEYARIVRERAVARRMHDATLQILQQLKAGASPHEVSAALAAASELILADKRSPVRLEDTLHLMERYQLGSEDALTAVGLDTLDQQYSPGRDELVIIGARPSVGKSAFAISLAERIARAGAPVLFVSIEMSGAVVNLRRVAAEAGISMSTMRQKGGIHTGSWDDVTEAFSRLDSNQVTVVSGKYSLADLVITIRSHVARHKTRAVFVDHLGLVKKPKADRHDLALGEITSTLARLSKDCGTTIFLLHQLNRQVERRDDPRPLLSDLRDSGNIEQDADAVWMLFRESYYRDDAGDKFEVIIAKNRNGPVGRVQLYFDERTGRFRE